jgi:hypothetical protein
MFNRPYVENYQLACLQMFCSCIYVKFDYFEQKLQIINLQRSNNKFKYFKFYMLVHDLSKIFNFTLYLHDASHVNSKFRICKMMKLKHLENRLHMGIN